MMRLIRISDMKPGMVYEVSNYKMWLIVSVQGVRDCGTGVQYVDFQELTIDGEETGEVSDAVFTFVDGFMHGSEYNILAGGT